MNRQPRTGRQATFRGAAAVGFVLVASLVLASTGSARATTGPDVIDLGTLGGSNSYAYAVNSSGQVVGYSDTAGNAAQHAFSWTQAGGMVDLGSLGGFSYARAVSPTGQVVGFSYLAGSEGMYHAFSWTQAGGMVDLGTLGGSSSAAFGVNGVGQVVGYSYVAGDDAYHAFSWTQAGGMVDLGTLGGLLSVVDCCPGNPLNDSGQVVGRSQIASGSQHAFSWTQAGGMVDLGDLGGGASYSYAVSATGQVVGYSYPAGGPTAHAFSWTQSGGMVDIDTLANAESYAYAVNATGQIVGQRTIFPGGTHAFSWTQSSGMVDLGTLGGVASFAYAVNSNGQAVGYSYTSGGAPYHAFSWTQAGGMVDLGTLGGDYSSAQALNDIGQVVGYSTTATGTNHATLWETVQGPGPTATLVLSPHAATNTVGTSHTVTATLTDANGQPTPGVTVRFKVSGSVTTSGSCIADANGQCSFTYTGPALPGADAIVAWADLDNDGVKDADEPSDEATKAWTEPASTPGQVTGGGQIPSAASGGNDIAFGFNAKSDSSGVSGNCNVVDISPVTNVKISCGTVTSVVMSGTHATIFATGTQNGQATTIRIDVDDLSEPGKGHDTFKIVTSLGYTASGTLAGGNIQIHA